MNVYQDRLSRVQQRLRADSLDAAVFAPSDQMRYLTGWAEYGHERLIALFVPAQGEPVFLAPTMHLPQTVENPAGVTDVRGWDDADGWHAAAGALLAEWKVGAGGLAIDDELYSVHLIALQNLAPGARCVAAGNLMARLREIKTADELERMTRSAAVTDAVYEEVLGTLRKGMTETDLQGKVARAYARHGTRPAFALICFGANAALPHHHTGASRLKRGDIVIIDIGCVLDDYASDITRTVAFGEPDPEAKRVYDVVWAAHRAAYDAGRPGVACEDVDRAAREVIAQAGYGEYFVHRTGHGIGLSCHEPPYIVAGNRQDLAEGMCFSDEPGIYLPGRFGVRIENIVTVTADGLRYLNAVPPSELLVV